MFTVDNTAPESLLPKGGKYTASIKKVEMTSSKAGNPMARVELVIPSTDPSLVEQKIAQPQTVFDFVVFGSDKDMCKIKANNFIKAMQLDGKEADALGDLVGKVVDITVRRQTDDYGEKLALVKYVEGTLKDGQEIPF